MNKEEERLRIGQLIADLRKERGWTQEELADRCNLGRSHIVRIEQGRYNVQLDTLAIIAEAFGMTVELVDSAILKAQKDCNGTPDNAPFSAKWLQDNIDYKDPRLDDEMVEIDINDVISDERGEAGCIDISYGSQVFWTINKGLSGDKWLCSCSPEFRSDDWIPSIYTIEDFKRLFRVAAGFDLPLKQ